MAAAGLPANQRASAASARANRIFPLPLDFALFYESVLWAVVSSEKPSAPLGDAADSAIIRVCSPDCAVLFAIAGALSTYGRHFSTSPAKGSGFLV